MGDLYTCPDGHVWSQVSTAGSHAAIQNDPKAGTICPKPHCRKQGVPYDPEAKKGAK